MTTKLKTDFEYDDIQIEGKTFNCSGTAEADYYYQKGRMYMSNGDPGYPDEEDFEVTDIDFTANEVDEFGKETEVTDEILLKKIKSELTEKLNAKDLSDWNKDDGSFEWEDFEDED